MWYVICDMSFYIIEILLHIYNVQQAEVISGISFTFMAHKLREH